MRRRALEMPSIRPMRRAEIPLYKRWMRQRHVADNWGSDPHKIAKKFFLPVYVGLYLAEISGRPIAYLQCWNHAYPGVCGIDIFIGEPFHLNRGLGACAVAILAHRLLAAGKRTVLIDPEPENLRAIHSYRAAGFVGAPEWDEIGRGRVVLRFAPSIRHRLSPGRARWR
jgi:RimJ/RimL family protein N-acetyltransferase